MTVLMDRIEHAVDHIIESTNGKIVLGIPLGLGKPNALVNALYERVANSPSVHMTILTALSLNKPSASNELQARFLTPFVARTYGDYENLRYLEDRQKNQLPPNIDVIEFFVQPGAEINNNYAQQHYISTNYTHAARDINAHKINVLAQQLAFTDGLIQRHYSFSANPEISLDILPLIQQRREQGETILVLGQLNQHLPFMPNDAECTEQDFDIIIDDPSAHKHLACTPNMPVAMAEHFIGLNASTLIKDNGTLQIGIGAMGDAVAASVLLREQHNDQYQALINSLELSNTEKDLIHSEGGINIFEHGLYGCSEMFTYGLFRLFEERIIRRAVRDEKGRDFVIHGGFFLGPNAFYERLINLSDEQKSKINMTHISFVNALYGNEALKREHRQHARFINTAFSVTAMGAIISDQREDGKMISGVGGQYNFVSQAHELEGARSIILVRATRESAGEVSSNILWRYGHTTIPRHLRDIVVTEYGIADLRGKTDSDVIKAMLNITDSRFQDALLEQAKASGKIDADYVIPESYRQNTPETLQAIVSKHYQEHIFETFPLGSDFTAIEASLIQALQWLKRYATPKEMLTLAKNLSFNPEDKLHFSEHLERMGLMSPNTIKEKVYQRLLIAALKATASS